MNKFKINKILIANRGEIAFRIMKTIHEIGKTSVAVYSDADADLPYVHTADEKYSLGSGNLHDTYLNQELIIRVALDAEADAIHPGYGFLSENAEFALLCKKNKLIFIGPESGIIEMMGNKSNARKTATGLGIPVIPGATGTSEEFLKSKDSIEYPVLIKPAAGGGGKGMQIVKHANELKKALADASREAMNYFGSKELYLEKYIQKARHIEVQVLADTYGKIIHLFERECSLQRRFQKIIEEAPAASISEITRDKITACALKLAKGINYTNAGTVEFILDENENFYFIEMNTRIQVEHPVTEMITGIDIVKEQIKIAEGQQIQISQSDIHVKGYAIEARLYAEDPESGFMPSSGKIAAFDLDNIQVRTDSGYTSGNSVSPYYDPMLTKIISHGKNRIDAMNRLSEAIKHLHIAGVKTNKSFLATILQSEDFKNNKLYTTYLDENPDQILDKLSMDYSRFKINHLLHLIVLIYLSQKYQNGQNTNVWKELGNWRMVPELKIEIENSLYTVKYEQVEPYKEYNLCVDGKCVNSIITSVINNIYTILVDGVAFKYWACVDRSEINFDIDSFTYKARRIDITDTRYLRIANRISSDANTKEIKAPLNGKVVKVNVKEKQKVKIGAPLLIVESMKMENKIASPANGEIENIHVDVGELVELNKLLITLK